MSEGTPIKQLPKLVDPRKLAHFNAKLVGIVPEECLPRLQDATFNSGIDSEEGRVISAELEFFRDEQGRRRLSGNVSACVTLECQRCLEPFVLNIATEVNLAVVLDEEQLEMLPRSLDPWLISEEQGDLHSVLEDELLLALPASPLHDFECIDASRLSVGDEVEETQAASGDEDNPFSVLASLKQDLKKTD
ncbi:YceD family protein [Teredinibacter haidensis]|uniref:YceD family protein n=1 Tax=Teredinibacter haidensis TaxID=2731755 RepID=UPI0009491497|nr:YceD family protein [Teredinibacter haidensis]